MKTAFIFVASLTVVAASVGAQGCKKDDTNVTTTSSTTTTTTTTTSGTGGAAPTCDAYCTDAIDTCGASAGTTQFDTSANCLATCAFWAAGQPGDQDGDSLACRDYHVIAAADDAVTHCPHAGPAGGAVCGASNCDAFCALNLAVCTGANSQFASLSACTTACDAWAGALSPYAANPASTTDNFACRMYHLTAAATDPAFHCDHTGDASTICTQ